MYVCVCVCVRVRVRVRVRVCANANAHMHTVKEVVKSTNMLFKVTPCFRENVHQVGSISFKYNF